MYQCFGYTRMKVMQALHLSILIIIYNIGTVLNRTIDEKHATLNAKFNYDDESIQNKGGKNLGFNIVNKVRSNQVDKELIGKGQSEFYWTRHNTAKNNAISTETVTENIRRSKIQDDFVRNQKRDLTEAISNGKFEFNWTAYEDTTVNVKISIETKSNADEFEKDQQTTMVDSKISNNSETSDGNNKDVTNISEDTDKSEFQPTASGLLYRRKREDDNNEDDDDEVGWIWDPCNKGEHPEALSGELICAKDHEGPCASIDNRDNFGSNKCKGNMRLVKVGGKTLCLRRNKRKKT